MRTAGGISSRLPRKYDRHAEAVCDLNGIKDEKRAKARFLFYCFCLLIRQVGLPFFVGLPLILFALNLYGLPVFPALRLFLLRFIMSVCRLPRLTVISACRSVYTICPAFASLSCPIPCVKGQRDLIYDICRVSRKISVDVAFRRF